MSKHPAKRHGKHQRRGGVIVPRKLKWRHHIAAWFIAFGLRAIAATWRCTYHDPHNVFEDRKIMIASVWHNRLALSMMIWRGYVRPRTTSEGLVALISASHDGGMLSRALLYFGVRAVRGSSSRRGAQALLELTNWIERGYHVAITPDGPRGPRYVAQDGPLALSQLTGSPIVPISARIHGKIILKSWDRFQLPLPFARCEVQFGKPLQVPRETTPEQREELRAELQRRMMALADD